MSRVSLQRLLPAAVIAALLAILLLSAAPALAQGDGTAPYTVKPGDTLKRIADDYGLTVDRLIQTNPIVRDPNLIYPGQVLILPSGRSEGPHSVRKPERMFVWLREKDGGRVERDEQLYLVRSGDNLARVAKSYGVSIERLLAANPALDAGTMLLRGELVRIPEGRGEIVPLFYQTVRDSTSR